MNSIFYDFDAKTLHGKVMKFDNYKNKVVLVVNTASKCGFTPQYAGLEQLYEKYKDQGLVILGFPCNQFGKQEPGSAKEIEQGCLINYGVTFQMFDKVEVNGKGAHPLFNYLKSELPGTFGKKIKWNFTKFLIDQDGHPVKRFASAYKPEKIEKYVQKLVSN